jgi:hypothetical protein
MAQRTRRSSTHTSKRGKASKPPAKRAAKRDVVEEVVPGVVAVTEIETVRVTLPDSQEEDDED